MTYLGGAARSEGGRITFWGMSPKMKIAAFVGILAVAIGAATV